MRYCKNCSAANDDDARFCVSCGSAIEFDAASASSDNLGDVGDIGENTQAASGAPVENPVKNYFKAAFTDTLFLVMAILISVSVGLSILSSSGIPIINALVMIFMWILYANAKKGILDSNYIRYISGTVYATKIIYWVVVGFCAVFGIVCFASSSIVDTLIDASPEVSEMLVTLDLTMSVLAIFVGVVLIVAAILIALFNVFAVNAWHSLVKSMYKSANSGELKLDKYKTAKNWVLAFAIISTVSALNSVTADGAKVFLSALSSLSTTAMLFVVYFWMKKFLDVEPVANNAESNHSADGGTDIG